MLNKYHSKHQASHSKSVTAAELIAFHTYKREKACMNRSLEVKAKIAAQISS